MLVDKDILFNHTWQWTIVKQHKTTAIAADSLMKRPYGF